MMSKYRMKDMEKNRQRNQFTRRERDHLLNIMKEFGEKLEDKNLSILARKEIWFTIDNKFRDGGFNNRTIAQLKKYWQNYKYHNGRNKWRKENESTDIKWKNNQLKLVDAVSTADQSSPFEFTKQPAIVFSESNASGSSVTVSVLNSQNENEKMLSDNDKSPGRNSVDKNEENEMKKMKRKCLLLQPKMNKNSEDGSDMQPVEMNNQIYPSTSSDNNQFNIPDNHQQTYGNVHFLRQLQLLRYLEVEEYKLKVKLAHLKMLEMKNEKELQ